MDGSTELLFFLVFASICSPSQAAMDRFHHNAGSPLDNIKAFENCRSKLCASRVSFCIIMKDCSCFAKPGKYCRCCQDCVKCLGNLWSECCDCVALCHVAPNKTVDVLSNHERSNFGDLKESSLPPLFEALSYGSNIPVAFMTRPREHRFTSPDGVSGDASNSTVNVGKGNANSQQDVCKVAFFDKCLTMTDCVNACASMGSHRYRWFDNGCCQCVGQRCADYGELQPLCKDCSSY